MTPANTPRSSLFSRAVHGVMRASARLGMAEPEVLGLEAVVRPGDHVFDVGAAYGMYTFPLANIVGGTGRVHAFEPQSRQLRTVRALRGLTRAPHITVTHAAVGDASGDHTMVLPYKFGVPIYGHTHVGEGTEHGPTPPLQRTKRWSTPMHTVDSWCDDHAINAVSFIKVDVEGFEPHVLVGAQRTIDHSRPSMLLEIEDRHLGRYGRDANAFADEIRTNWPEYGMYTWGGRGWQPADRIRLDTRNYLFATDAAFVRPVGRP